MATTSQHPRPTLDLREQLARIDRIQADSGRKLATASRTWRESRFVSRTIAITALGAGAALFAAGAASTKLLID